MHATRRRLAETATEDLAALARSGDRRAHDALVGRLQPRVFRLAAALVMDGAGAAAAAEEAFAVALGRGGEPFVTSVVTAALEAGAARRGSGAGFLDGVDDEGRAAVVLRDVEGLTLAETANALGRTPEAVDASLARAPASSASTIASRPARGGTSSLISTASPRRRPSRRLATSPPVTAARRRSLVSEPSARVSCRTCRTRPPRRRERPVLDSSPRCFDPRSWPGRLPPSRSPSLPSPGSAADQAAITLPLACRDQRSPTQLAARPLKPPTPRLARARTGHHRCRAARRRRQPPVGKHLSH